MNLDLSTIMQVGTTAFVGVILYVLQDIRTQLTKVHESLSNKMDRSEHDADCRKNIEAIRESAKGAYERLDSRISLGDSKFCGHSHEGIEGPGRIILKG